MEINERLVAKDPTNTTWLRGLLVSKNLIGDILETQGDLGEALRYQRACIAIAEDLVRIDPAKSVIMTDP